MREKGIFARVIKGGEIHKHSSVILQQINTLECEEG